MSVSDEAFVRETFAIVRDSTSMVVELRRALEVLGENVKGTATEEDVKELKAILGNIANQVSRLASQSDQNGGSPRETLEKVIALAVISSGIQDAVRKTSCDVEELKPTAAKILDETTKAGKDVKEISVWTKVKFPFLNAAIVIFLWAIGFFGTVYKITSEMRDADRAITEAIVRQEKSIRTIRERLGIPQEGQAPDRK